MPKRWLVLIQLAPVAFAAMLGSALACPQPFFPYSAHEGRLSIYSDRPFDTARARVLLDAVDQRLSRSPLDHPGESNAIFISNAGWRQLIFMNFSSKASGVNFAPLTRNVFLRTADIDTGVLVNAWGHPAPPPRTLTYYCAHEITHTLTAEDLGAAHLWNKGLPQWIREGYADYVGMGSKIDVDALYREYRAHDGRMDYEKSGYYAKFRLLVAFMLDREGWSIHRLLRSGLSEADAERLMNASLAPGHHAEL
jgi:hypothetical protein